MQKEVDRVRMQLGQERQTSERLQRELKDREESERKQMVEVREWKELVERLNREN